MKLLILISPYFLLLPTAFLFYALIQSIIEKEARASARLAVLTIVWIGFFLTAILMFGSSYSNYFFIISSSGILLSGFILIFPWPLTEWEWERGNPDQIDERNIMFSRAELVPGTVRYNSYYEEFPAHKQADDNFREDAGLLSKNSTFYKPLIFSAADAAFFTVESFHSRVEGEEKPKQEGLDPALISNFITRWAGDLGCHSIGVTPLMKHHLYHTGGRKHNYGEPVKNDHKYAIAFTVEMDFLRVKSAPRGPIIMESSAQYLRAGNIAVQIASFLRNLGYPARAHIDGKYQVRCPEVAKDAGLGDLGRMSLLMTPDLGPRVRIGVVTTDFPMIAGGQKPDPSMMKFCRKCKKCANNCPAQAISFDDPKPNGGAVQWIIDQEACFSYWCKTGTDCGRCISVCPYSHPDNFLHKFVRHLIKTSPLFLLFAVRMDDWLYGKKPPERKPAKWMDSK